MIIHGLVSFNPAGSTEELPAKSYVAREFTLHGIVSKQG
jgi:hypothetical protein